MLLSPGFIDVPFSDLKRVGECLTYRKEHREELSLWEDNFTDEKPIVRELVERYWKMMVDCEKIDIAPTQYQKSVEKAISMISTETLVHKEGRDVGAESLCLQAIRQLGLDRFLLDSGWNVEKIRTALAHLVIRCVYSPSELASMRIFKDNSAIGELLGIEAEELGKREVYSVAPDFYKMKDSLECHLCGKTDNLFNLTNRIFLYDWTNFYFEGRKASSTKAKYGRSKEKRNDCKLLVLALCINTEGFIRYSSILEGNTSDPKSLPDMIEGDGKKKSHKIGGEATCHHGCRYFHRGKSVIDKRKWLQLSVCK